MEKTLGGPADAATVLRGCRDETKSAPAGLDLESCKRLFTVCVYVCVYVSIKIYVCATYAYTYMQTFGRLSERLCLRLALKPVRPEAPHHLED